MEQTTNNNDGAKALLFLNKWKHALIIVFCIAFVASLLVALFTTPKYKSTAVIFPANSNRVSKAILADRYSIDYMDYGLERDCEYAIQILSSSTMMLAANAQFNLYEHYEIDTNQNGYQYKLAKAYMHSVKVERTEYMAVEISVIDEDPQMSADLANFITSHYDTICHEIQYGRSKDAYTVMTGVCAELEQNINALNDSLRAHPDRKSSYDQLIMANCQELANLQSRAAQTKVDMNENIHYKFWLEKANVPDKKYSPKRLLVTIVGTLSTWLLFLFLLMVVEKIREIKSQATEESR